MANREEVTVNLHFGDCLDLLPTIASESIDAVITDSPYPHIKRDYGTWTTEEWWALIVEGVIPEVRRILKPTGSAVFILQPNSEKVGKMRGWLWEFMAWVCREWNMVQDVWWWNVSMLPSGGATQQGLMRQSLKSCVWAGESDCYRNQKAILWNVSQQTKAMERTDRARGTIREHLPSGHSIDRNKIYDSIRRRGGVTPFNVIPIGTDAARMADKGIIHSAGTPLKLADWWTRYICPPGGTVLDPFMGSGTMGLAALNNGCSFIGIEKMPGQEYFATAEERIKEALHQYQHQPVQLEMATHGR